jgi:hypothetical protein
MASTPFACNFLFLGTEDLLLDLVEHSGDGGVHIAGFFCAMVKFVAGLDVDFRNVPLMLFYREDKVSLHHLINDGAETLESIRSELSNRFRDFDMATRNIHGHCDPPNEKLY